MQSLCCHYECQLKMHQYSAIVYITSKPAIKDNKNLASTAYKKCANGEHNEVNIASKENEAQKRHTETPH